MLGHLGNNVAKVLEGSRLKEDIAKCRREMVVFLKQVVDFIDADT